MRRWARRARQGARPRRAAGPVGCALGALSLFLARFDSVLFLSQFLGKIFFKKKKNKIKKIKILFLKKKIK